MPGALAVSRRCHPAAEGIPAHAPGWLAHVHQLFI
jgi:hypothetical protein